MKSILPSHITARLASLRDRLLVGLVERDVPIRLALLAALAGEHLLLIGPPGTAKSMVARRLHLAFGSSTYFERLLTRFSVPEELFGPLSIKGLEEDRYERLTASYLPKASIAFLDEIFKANSAILNALLTLLNEREFDNGTQRQPAPLIAAVGASNELPEGEELDALFDRFLLRYYVAPVSKASFPKLLTLQGEPTVEVPPEAQMSPDELRTIRDAVVAVTVPDDVLALLADLREWCVAENITVSDRRWRKLVKLLQTSALTNGRTSVSIWDCWLLQHCLWNVAEQRAKLFDWYAARAGASAAMDPLRLTRIVVSWEGQLKKDQSSRSQLLDDEGNLLFKGVEDKPTTHRHGKWQAMRDGKEPLFLAPASSRTDHPNYYGKELEDRTNGGKGYTRPELESLWVKDSSIGNQWHQVAHWPNRDAYLANKANHLLEERDLQPLMEPTRQKAAHVESCLSEIASLEAEVEAYKDKLSAHIRTLEQDIRAHLWVTDDFAEAAATSLLDTALQVDTLLTRIIKLRQGFDMLPREARDGLPR